MIYICVSNIISHGTFFSRKTTAKHMNTLDLHNMDVGRKRNILSVEHSMHSITIGVLERFEDMSS